MAQAAPTINISVSAEDYQALLEEHDRNERIINRIRSMVGRDYDNINHPAASVFQQLEA